MKVGKSTLCRKADREFQGRNGTFPLQENSKTSGKSRLFCFMRFS